MGALFLALVSHSDLNDFIAIRPRSQTYCELKTRLTKQRVIECFRGRHRGGRNFTSFFRLSGPFFHAAKRAFLTLELAPP